MFTASTARAAGAPSARAMSAATAMLAQLKRNRHPPRGGPLLVVSSRSGGRGSPITPLNRHIDPGRGSMSSGAAAPGQDCHALPKSVSGLRRLGRRQPEDEDGGWMEPKRVIARLVRATQ